MSGAAVQILPVECKPKTWEQVDAIVAELKRKYGEAGGENLRAELVTSLYGARLTVVFDWEDM